MKLVMKVTYANIYETIMLKIVLIGPESTGKSTLATQLATHYNVSWVREFAREYIEKLDLPYVESDLLEIGKGQIKLENQALQKNQSIVFFDTNLIVLKIWSLNAYKKCDDWILNEINERDYDLYFLCGIDMPWEFDEQREHPHMRAYFYEVYKNELKKMNANFVELTGNEVERLEKATQVLDKYIKKHVIV